MSTSRITFDLKKLNRVACILTETQDLQEIKTIRDKAEAARKYAQNSGLGLSVQNQAAELKLVAERRAGKLLAEMRLRGGDKRSKSHDEISRLEHFGIDRNNSSRWQQEAAVPERVFKQYVAEANKHGREITSQELLRLAKTIQGNNGRAREKPNTRAYSNGTANRNGEDLLPAVLVTPDRLREIRDGLNEIQAHRSLLEAILEPVCHSWKARLKTGERRIVLRLLTEIETIVLEIGGALSCPSE